MVNSIFQYLSVFSSKCRYLPVNATGMENTHICRHFANLEFDILFYTYMGNFHIKQWGDKNCNSVKLKVKHNSKDFMVVKCGFSPYEIEHGPWNFT